MLSPRKLEKHLKGAASHRRINILLLLEKRPGLSLLQIAEALKTNFKTTSDHLRRLTTAGLVTKGRHTAVVPHRLTARGHTILKFLRTLE